MSAHHLQASARRALVLALSLCAAAQLTGVLHAAPRLQAVPQTRAQALDVGKAFDAVMSGDADALSQLTAAPRERVLLELDQRLKAPLTEALAQAGLRVLETLGQAGDIVRLMRLAPNDDASPAWLGAFQSAARAIVRRDGNACAQLELLAGTSAYAVRTSIVRALAESNRNEAALLLMHWARLFPDLRCEALARLGRMGERLSKPVPEEVLADVRRYILERDEDVLSEAIVAAGRLEDFDAVPALIELLSDVHAGHRTEALFALQHMTELRLRASPERWRDWFAMERRFWEQDSEKAFSALKGSNRTAKVTALNQISSLHAWRHELALRVVDVLDDPDSDAALLANSTLARLRSRASLPALLDALERAESGTSATHPSAAEIAATLRTITGLDLSDDATLWKAAILAGTTPPHGKKRMVLPSLGPRPALAPALEPAPIRPLDGVVRTKQSD